MASLVVGGVTYDIPIPNFSTLKAIWPLVKEMKAKSGEEMDPIEAVSSTIEIAAIAAQRKHPNLTVQFIEDNLKPDEMTGVSRYLSEMMSEAGLIAKPGEAPPPGTSSTETSTL